MLSRDSSKRVSVWTKERIRFCCLSASIRVCLCNERHVRLVDGKFSIIREKEKKEKRADFLDKDDFSFFIFSLSLQNKKLVEREVFLVHKSTLEASHLSNFWGVEIRELSY